MKYFCLLKFLLVQQITIVASCILSFLHVIPRLMKMLLSFKLGEPDILYFEQGMSKPKLIFLCPKNSLWDNKMQFLKNFPFISGFLI